METQKKLREMEIALAALPTRKYYKPSSGSPTASEGSLDSSSHSSQQDEEAGGTPPRADKEDECSECEEQECAICLDAFASGDVLRSLPCSHEFHLKCIDSWLHRKVVTWATAEDGASEASKPPPSCPLCKRQVVKTTTAATTAAAITTTTAAAATTSDGASE